MQSNGLSFWKVNAGSRRSHQLSIFQSAIGNELLEQRVLPAAVIVTADPNLETTEAGGTAQFSVKLDTQPSANVSVRVRSSNSGEGSSSVGSLLFTPENWDQPQVVTVQGIDDAVDDDDVNYSIILDKLKTKDRNFKRQNPEDVSLVNRDNDVAGFIVTPTSGLETTEQGGTASFTIRLTSQPTHTVQVRMHSTNIQEGTEPNSRTFNKKNWNQPQTVTITGVNDFIADGDQAYQVVFEPASGSDPKYIGLVPETVSLINRDDDIPGFTVSPMSGLIVNEGGTKNVTVRLNSQPTEDVRVFISGGGSEASVSPQELIFTPRNWTNPQIFTIHGTQDNVQDGDQPFNFSVQTESVDPVYQGLSRSVSTTIHDTTPAAGLFDGTYTGSYSGTVSGFGVSAPVSGAVQFTVSGNTVTVTVPSSGSGTIENDGTATFSPTGGSVAGAVFSGVFSLVSGGGVAASGGWTYSQSGVIGSGTWSATRI